MLDVGISQLALVGVVALIVIGPEKLPRVARMAGTMLGKAQRYVADVKAEVNRSMELEELKKMKDSVESAARDVQSSVQQSTSDFEQEWSEVTASLTDRHASDRAKADPGDPYSLGQSVYPQYKRPKKNFRLKQKAVPQWFKARTGTRTRALSGAARVARYRPKSQAL